MKTLEMVLNSAQERSSAMQPVDVGDQIDRYQYLFPPEEGPRMERIGEVQRVLEMGPRAKQQFLARLNIPAQYFDRCPTNLQWAQANFFAQQAKDKQVMIRTVQGNRARAILSEWYTPLDDVDVLPMVADILGDDEAQVQISDFNDDHTHIRILFPRTQVEVKRGDIVQTGIHFSNSEVGLRAVHIDQMVYRLICTNGAIRSKSDGKTAIRHVGNAGRLKDAIRHAISDAKVGSRQLLETFKKAVEHSVSDPKELIERHARSENLTQEQLQAALASFALEPDSTLFGVVNAFTHAAQREPSVERRFQVERAGTALLKAA